MVYDFVGAFFFTKPVLAPNRSGFSAKNLPQLLPPLTVALLPFW